MLRDCARGARTPLSRPQWALLLLAGAAYLAWGALYIHRTSFVADGERVFCLWDDGMIAMHYARNLVLGHGLRWNPGEAAVQGFSNLGVTLVMAALHLLPLGERTFALAFQVLNLGLLAAVATLAFGGARRIAPTRPAVAVAASLATLGCAPLSVWSLQGADTGLVALWIAAALYAASNPALRGRPWPAWLYALLGAGLLLRADMALPYAAICLCAVVMPGPRRGRLAIAAAVLAIATASLLTFGALYYGDLLPNTYYLKATGSPRALVLRSGVTQLGDWSLGLVPALGLSALATYRARQDPWVVGAAAIVVAMLAYCVWIGGDWAPQYGNRMFTPCLPLLAVLSAAGLFPLLERALVDWTAPARAWCLVAVAALVALLANPRAASAEWFSFDASTMYRTYNARNHARAVYLREHTDPDTVVGVHWAGVPIYFSERPAVDLLGKSDRHIAKLTVPRFSPGHSKWDWDYVMHERRPDIVLRATHGLRSHPEYLRQYVVVVRDGEPLFAIRRGSLGKLRDRRVVLEAVGEVGAGLGDAGP